MVISLKLLHRYNSNIYTYYELGNLLSTLNIFIQIIVITFKVDAIIVIPVNMGKTRQREIAQ